MNTATRQFIIENLNSDVHALALKKAPPKVELPLALRQIEARQLLRKKVPSWSENNDLLFPSHLSLEQCSSEATAQYKAYLTKGFSFADLTGGLGIDTYFISQHFQQSDYVETQPELCKLAQHNFGILQHKIEVHNESAEDYLKHCGEKDCFYIDPARRDTKGHKTISIADCTPNVLQLQERLLQQAKTVIIKLSPMLDISKALDELKCVKEIHVVSVANECKELLFVCERNFLGEPKLFCINLMTSQPIVSFMQDEERNLPLRLAESPSNYLYEPNASLMKAGCHKTLTAQFNVQKLHKNSHLYTSSTPIPDFPGRIFRIEGWTHYNKKIKQSLLEGIDKASITVRNFPLSAEELRKTLKIKEGDDIYLFATTIKGEEKVIIKTKKSACQKADL